MVEAQPLLGKNIGVFKTPTLRIVSRTAPFTHDGRLVTLKQVVDHYNLSGVKNPFLDNQIILLKLTESEKQDLVEMILILNEDKILSVGNAFLTFWVRNSSRVAWW